jgi:hypothetical protein
MKSKITGGATKLIFESIILNKYPVKYYQCIETGFIQTEDPFWLEESYSSAITKLDLGLVYRNQVQSKKFSRLILEHFDKKIFLDFAGGYGLFTRLMRDLGFNFLHHDIYCKNIFAEYFEADLNKLKDKFELLTAMEVFEHMKNPLEEIKNLFTYSDSILFTTELHTQQETYSKDWWYYLFETGQHISIFNLSTLKYLSKLFKCNFYTDGSSTHLFTYKTLKSNPFEDKESFIVRKARKILKRKEESIMPKSLLQSDFEYVKNLLSSK